ncbi:polysaccharide lyase family 7 protein [Oleiharenicola sp. Vm1]|uniref:polysaccharide lyase family 7 protein n=1 Tax=Oleiharenicola sp. Vm1 TaxID=3398393 RepID=UPI0039F4D564
MKRTLLLLLFLVLGACPALFAQTVTKFALPASAVTASTYDTANNAVPANAVDGSLSTRWAGQGDGAFITFDLGPSQTVSYVKIAWYQGNTRTENFEIRVSSDGLAFTTVWSGNSSGTTTNFETYDFTDTPARYVRIVGHGNSSGNGWNSVSECEVWGIVGSSGGGSTGTVPFTVESESVGYNSSYWSLVTDAAASGGTALKELVNSTGSAPGTGGLVYTFSLASSSTVYLQIKAKAANTSSDSVWARLDSGSWSQFTFDSTNQFTWRNKSYSSVAAGTHTFELRCREMNGLVDLVAVTLDNNTPPPVGTNIVAAPVFSPGGGTYTTAQNVTISSATSGATIRYTTNGTAPTSSTGTVYSGAVNLSATTTLQAIAYKSGMTDSPVTSATYTISASPPPQVAAPTFSPTPGSYSGAQSVTLSSATSGATIRYTTNGTAPTSSSGTVYSGAISVAETTTLKAIAYKSGMTDSNVTSATYTITTNGLDPNAPPGDNFDLSHWKITLPINNAEEHSAAELVAGYEHPDWFFTDPDTGGMTFKAPNLGDTTGGSTYARSELREMLAPSGSASAHANNWVTSTSSSSVKSAAGGVDGTMNATLSVDHVSTTGDSAKVGRVVVGQIHGPSSEVIRLYYHKRPTDTRGAIYFGHDNPSTGANTYVPILGDPNNLNPSNGILLGQVWSYEIKVVGHTLTVKVTPQGGSTTTVSYTIESGYDGLDLYFKAGVYNQNNTGTSDDYTQATFYSLTHTHP